LPVGLDNFGGAEIQELLDKDEHACTESPDSALPDLEVARGRSVRPDKAAGVGLPCG
jgi:hypothetical protein